MNKYFFERPLEEGIILSRPNRFIMYVKINDIIHKCFCPVTGRIGDFEVDGLQCLVSRKKSKLKEILTIEAISFCKDSKKHKNWIGINQTRVNNYMKFFLCEGILEIPINSTELKRDVKLGETKIDFQCGETYIEIKSFLDYLPTPDGIKDKITKNVISLERINTQIHELYLHANLNHDAVIIYCYMYPAINIREGNQRVLDLIAKTKKLGIKSYQINLKIQSDYVEFLNCYTL